MAMKLSTGARNALAVTTSLRGLLSGNVLQIYGGPVPASPDDSIGAAVLLCTISGGGTGAGLEFEAVPQNGVVIKLASQAWSGVNSASGTATFCRLCPDSDTGAASGTAIRLQGTVGQISADLEMSNIDLVSGAPLSVNASAFTVPERS